MAPTRRTHIVRISDAAPGDPPSDTYIDVEVLDAIAFRDINGEEMVLNMPKKNISACVKDYTGGDHGKQPPNPTRLSHMIRIVGDDPEQRLDIEVIDILSFRGANGEEWILDMNSTNGQPSVFNKSDNTGDSRSTRRTHNEKLSRDMKEPNPTEFVTVERCDSIAFRSILGREMIIKCPSSDDPRGSSPRADTVVTSPRNYNPNDPDGPVPPVNKDENVYIAFVKNPEGGFLDFMTGKKKISQGPFWWIRKVSAGTAYILVTIIAKNSINTAILPPAPEIKIGFGDPKKKALAKLVDKIEHVTHQQIPAKTSGTTAYFVWSDIAEFPTLDTYDNLVAGGPHTGQEPIIYSAQFARTLNFETGFAPPENFGFPIITVLSTGWFETFDHAASFANALNNVVAPRQEYLLPDGSVSQPVSVSTFYPVGFFIPQQLDPLSVTITTGRYLISIPTAEATTEFDIALIETDPHKGGISNIIVEGYSDLKKPLKKVADTEKVDADDRPEVDAAVGSNTYKVATEVVAGAHPEVKKHKVKISITGGNIVQG